MKDVRNNTGKLICQIDEKARIVEIVLKGSKTTIQFADDGTAKIKNAVSVA